MNSDDYQWQAAQAQYQALGNTQALGLGYQSAIGNQQSITDHQALAQQWRDRAEDQTRFALQAKCEEAYQDHMDNALRFEQWAKEAAPEPIDYLKITREICGG